MNRTELFALAEKHPTREGLRQALIDYLQSPAGQEVIKNTPRITIDYGNNVFEVPLEQSIERIADLIMQEV